MTSHDANRQGSVFGRVRVCVCLLAKLGEDSYSWHRFKTITTDRQWLTVYTCCNLVPSWTEIKISGRQNAEYQY